MFITPHGDDQKCIVYEILVGTPNERELLNVLYIIHVRGMCLRG